MAAQPAQPDIPPTLTTNIPIPIHSALPNTAAQPDLQADSKDSSETTSSKPAIPDGKDPEESWIYIRSRLYSPFSPSSSSPPPREKSTYMECYSAVFNFLNRFHKNSRGALHITKLYSNIEEFLRSGLKSLSSSLLASKDGDGDRDGIIEEYLVRWKEFVEGTKYNGNVLRYMTRHYVARERDEGNLNVWSIEKMSFMLWKREVFDTLKERLLKEYRLKSSLVDENEDEGEDWVKVSKAGDDQDGREEAMRLVKGFGESYELLRREMEVTGEDLAAFDEVLGSRDEVRGIQ